MTPNPKLPINQGTAILPALPPWLAYTQGNIWHVKPVNGLDTNSGKSPRQAFKTLAACHDAMTANQNDICLFYAESAATSAGCTDYQSSMLTWSKNMCHLIGVNNGISLGARSRISNISSWTSANPTMLLSANGCYVAGVQIWSSCTDVNTLGALKVTGQRNLVERCHIAGMGAATNDVLGAYSLLLSGSTCAENEFRNCAIGMDNISLGAYANSQILVAATPYNIKFVDCELIMKSSSATNHLFLRVPTTTLQGPLKFIRCFGTNGGSATLTYAVSIHASAGGKVYFKDCAFDATDVSAADETNIFVSIGGVNNTSGLFTLVETT